MYYWFIPSVVKVIIPVIYLCCKTKYTVVCLFTLARNKLSRGFQGAVKVSAQKQI